MCFICFIWWLCNVTPQCVARSMPHPRTCSANKRTCYSSRRSSNPNLTAASSRRGGAAKRWTCFHSAHSLYLFRVSPSCRFFFVVMCVGPSLCLIRRRRWCHAVWHHCQTNMLTIKLFYFEMVSEVVNICAKKNLAAVSPALHLRFGSFAHHGNRHAIPFFTWLPTTSRRYMIFSAVGTIFCDFADSSSLHSSTDFPIPFDDFLIVTLISLPFRFHWVSINFIAIVIATLWVSYHRISFLAHCICIYVNVDCKKRQMAGAAQTKKIE